MIITDRELKYLYLKLFEGSTIMDRKIDNLITEIHHNPIIIKAQAKQLDDFWQSTSSEMIIQPLYLYATGEEKDDNKKDAEDDHEGICKRLHVFARTPDVHSAFGNA